MTPTSIIVLCLIVSAFVLFGGALAWGDFYSRKRPASSAAAKPAGPGAAFTPAKWRDAA